MSNPETSQKKSPTATEPIINIISPRDGGEISWEVREDTNTQEENDQEDKKEDIHQPEEVIENDSDQQLEDQETTEEGEEKPKKVRPSKTADRRIADVTRKYRQTEAVLKQSYLKNDQVERENEELKRALLSTKQEKIAAEENALKYYMKNIESEHATALEEGNSEKAAEATRLMAEYAARREAVLRQKNELDNYAKAKPPAQPVQPTQTEQYDDSISQISQSEDFQHNGQEWIKKNLWADSNSKNFNKKMLQEAESHLHQLGNQYTFEGRAEEIGSPEFFEEITEYVKETFNISSPKPKKLFSSSQSSNVSAVSRTNTVPNIQKTNQDIILTPEQIKTAHAMVGVRFNGQRLEDRKVAENMYKENLRKQMEQDRQMKRS